MDNNKIKSGVIWTILGRYSNQFMSLFLGIFLARLLSPEDYGIIGMVVIFISIGDVFTKSGLGLALIQRKNISQTDLSTVFWMNMILGAVIAIALFASNGIIADFYNEPRLRDVVKAYSITFIVSALIITQYIQLRRDLKFREVETIDIVGTLGGGIVGLVCALNGLSYWSIVAQQLSNRFFRLATCFYYNRWLPSFEFSKDSLRSLAGFSIYALLIKVLRITVNKLDVAITGKIANTEITGLYSKAQFLANLPSTTFVKALQKASFPILTKQQDDRDAMKKTYRKMILLSVFVIYPALFFLWNYAELVIGILLGDQWLGVVPYLKLFCFVVIFYPYNELAINVLMAKGKARNSFGIELLIRSVLLISLLIGMYYGGVLGLIYAKIAIGVFSFFISTAIISNDAHYRAMEQIKDLFIVSIPFICSSVMILVMDYYLGINDFLEIAIYGCLFLAISIISGNEIMKIALGYASGMLKKIR